MPELPEISNLAMQMNKHLKGMRIEDIVILQPKSLNVPVEDFKSVLNGATIQEVGNRGKWIVVKTTAGYLLLNLGMGGEILLITNRNDLPQKYRMLFNLSANAILCINFWWFGYSHFVPLDELSRHEMTAKLGPDALSIDVNDLCRMFNGKRGTLKSFLLDQSCIAGIGNFYVQDILFLAKLHPMRKLNSLTEKEIKGLITAIQKGLKPSLEKGGAWYETDLFGEKGRFTSDDMFVAYKEGKPCPVCGALIEKIKTGGTSSFICPHCQI
jgi:formamidopyrimidine-DNA glycosylase